MISLNSIENKTATRKPTERYNVTYLHGFPSHHTVAIPTCGAFFIMSLLGTPAPYNMAFRKGGMSATGAGETASHPRLDPKAAAAHCRCCCHSTSTRTSHRFPTAFPPPRSSSCVRVYVLPLTRQLCIHGRPLPSPARHTRLGDPS